MVFEMTRDIGKAQRGRRVTLAKTNKSAAAAAEAVRLQLLAQKPDRNISDPPSLRKMEKYFCILIGVAGGETLPV